MKIRITALLVSTFCLVQASMVQSQQQTPTPPGSQALIPSGGNCPTPDPNAIHEYVSYDDEAPLCSEPTITVQTLTNPLAEPCFVFIDFSVDDDIIIDGQMYQSPGTDFSYHDGVCPDANGEHSDQYCRRMEIGEQITLGVRNNFRGYIYLHADVYFSRISNDNEPSDTNTKPNDEKRGGDQGDCSGMARYSAHALLASLNIQDTPLRYSPPRGPAINFTVTYNQREAGQPETFNYSNLGPKWTFDWFSYVADNPNDPSADAAIYVSGGGTENYSGFDPDTQSYLPDAQSHAVLVRTSPAAYEKRFADGSKQVFDISDAGTSPRKIFMRQVVDPAGNAVTIGYDGSFRIITLTDALEQVTTLDYELEGDPLKITKVTDPFGRFAMFDYTNGQLTRITDPVGIQSQFSYVSDTDFINSLTTPYGTSHFATGQNGANRWIEMTDPRGGTERVEYKDGAIGGSEPVAPPGFTNSALDVANAFYWDKKAYDFYPDYTKARIIHWAKNSDGSVSGIVASEKAPLENRVWYAYAGQSDTNHTGTSASRIRVARVLDDGTTQSWQYQYNDFGHATQSIDPVGRVMSYDYDTNKIDLLRVRQTTGSNNELLRSLSYNSFHEPLTDTDPAGQTTTYSYNSFGQVLTVENPRHEITTYAYGDGSGGHPVGYLISITGPVFGGSSPVTSFTYDSANRVRVVRNDPDGYETTTDYDDLDRQTQITYPDGTTQQFQYTDNERGMTLDLTATKDRLNRWTYRHYNENRQMDSITDPLPGHTTLYNWCTCGSLTSITDPDQNVTTFNRDLQSRLTSKVFQDTSAINYTYEDTTSRLKFMTDPNGQTTHYQYYVDDNLQQVSYTNAVSPTPTVSYIYDPNYNRVTSMADGIGTTNYTYYPITLPPVLGAGRLKDVDGPLTNDTITYTYDELGRTTGQSINGVSSSIAFDSLGRLGTSDNTLGHFSRTYDGVTSRLQQLAYPYGVRADYTYFGNTQDRRLQTLRNSSGNGATTLSQFDYTHDPEAQIQTLTKFLSGSQTPLSFQYDAARQLTSVGTINQLFSYSYDNSGNRYDVKTYGQLGLQSENYYTVNNLNQLATVSVNSGPPVPLHYDGDGNLTDDAAGKSYEWDAANRMVAINYTSTGNRTEFAYDGLGRRVKITEYGSGVTATIQPSGSSYTPFNTAPFTLSSGSYTLTFQGLNPNGGDNTALVDLVKLNNTLVPNGSFESPTVTDYQVDPTNAVWNFSGSAGIAANGGTYTSHNPNAPDGNQVAFIQNNGSLWLSWPTLPGTYTLSFQATQRGSNNNSYQQLRVNMRPSPGPTSVKTFVWSGNAIAEERDSTGATVKKRFFADGEQRIGGADAGNYYYTRDHLGSVREVTDSNGTLKGQYDYDAWGNAVVIKGKMQVDFGYTGHYFHQPSGLNLAIYRAYSPTVGRWISRDPIDFIMMRPVEPRAPVIVRSPQPETSEDGPNLYVYGRNSPTTRVDPDGAISSDPNIQWTPWFPCPPILYNTCAIECIVKYGRVVAACNARVGVDSAGHSYFEWVCSCCGGTRPR